MAELVDGESATIESSTSVSAALAVLSGIASVDAACCAALGRRSRGQDHKAAVDLVRQVEPDGAEAAKSLDRLLDMKNAAHHGVIHISGKDLVAVLRNARKVLDFATAVTRR